VLAYVQQLEVEMLTELLGGTLALKFRMILTYLKREAACSSVLSGAVVLVQSVPGDSRC
jgi:hypothetical protein